MGCNSKVTIKNNYKKEGIHRKDIRESPLTVEKQRKKVSFRAAPAGPGATEAGGWWVL